jgi:hypothetical protein
MSYQQPNQGYYAQPPPPQGQYMAPQQPVSLCFCSREFATRKGKIGLLIL